MTVRFYSSVSAETTLTNAINNSVTSMQVGSTTGLPSVPFTLAVDYESASEELVEVTVVAGTTLTITRAIDGTSAASHNSGARVRHVSSARDFTDSRNHENASTDVHGLASGAAVVGTTTTQTLTNKTLSGGTISGTIAGSPTFSGTVTFSTNISVAGNIAGNPTFTGTPVFTNLTISGTVGGNLTFSGTVNATGTIQSTRATAASIALASIVTADTFDRFRILSDGDMEWGPGNAGRDTNLYRGAANQLNTDDSLVVGGSLTTTGGATIGGNTAVTGTLTATGTADFGHTETTSGITYATDFSAGSMVFRETAGVKFIDVEVVRSGATFTPANTSGNITPDLTICTLPAGTRPPSALYVCASTGVGHGSLRINSDGTCELLTWIPDPVTITNGSTIRFTATWID
jgi:hypothetical protein